MGSQECAFQTVELLQFVGDLLVPDVFGGAPGDPPTLLTDPVVEQGILRWG